MKIMNKLPVKSLLRFRMVSKSWKFTIDSNIFVREYASRQCAILWNPSIRKFSGIEVPYMANRLRIDKIVWGFVVHPDTVLGNARLPRIGIRIKRSWGVAVVVKKRPSSSILYFQDRKLSCDFRNHIDNDENWYICAWLLEVEAAVVTSRRVLFVMPSQNIAKLIGFTMDDDPIVVVDMGHEIVHTLQVYDRPSQQFHTLGIVDNGGSFFIGPYKESLILFNV
ncbi:F-box domain containing protein [Tanacetum coccineum]